MKHLNENSIQAFLDGELSETALVATTEHLSVCSACAEALLVAEAEMAEVDFLFAAEKSSFVPTQRIWARIENEIDVCAWAAKPQKQVHKNLWQQCATVFSAGHLAFAGGLAAVVLVSLVSLGFLEQHLDATQNDVATIEQPVQIEILESALIPSAPVVAPTNVVAPKSVVASKKTFDFPASAAPRATKVIYPASIVKKIARSNPQSAIRNPQSDGAPLAEEKGYLNSIAELSKVVGAAVETEMPPAMRVEYERNMALTDRAIYEMQREVRRNPADENAKRILFASYESKIELLSNVSGKTQLVASLQ